MLKRIKRKIKKAKKKLKYKWIAFSGSRRSRRQHSKLVRTFRLCSPRLLAARRRAFEKQEKLGIKSIPVFIISYNRLSYLSNLIEKLESKGITNIVILDNASSYEPLLEYYRNTEHRVIYLNKNYGHMAFWEAPELAEFRNDFYVVTDPDIEPIDECPEDFMERFFEMLRKYPYVRKVGFSLKIDDLPADIEMSSEVRNWESQYYDCYIEADNAYVAEIDTTFAMYIPDSIAANENFLSAFRMGFPYQTRHLPWYKKADEISEEDIFYANNKTNGWWDPTTGEMTYAGVENK